MSKGPIIPAVGSSYADSAYVRKLKVKAGGTIAKGDVVKLSSTADDGYTVLECTTGVPPLGVALDAAVAGDYIHIQVGGLGLVDLVTSNAVAADAWMIPHSAAGAVTTDAVDASTAPGLILGLALADDSGTTQAAGTYWLCPLMAAGL